MLGEIFFWEAGIERCTSLYYFIFRKIRRIQLKNLIKYGTKKEPHEMKI